MARIYEVPYQPDAGLVWSVLISGRVIDRFDSRFEALRAAVNKASAEGGDTGIAVEGADGIWRPFGSDAKRPMPSSRRVGDTMPVQLSVVR